MLPPPPRSTRTDPLCPSTTLVRSIFITSPNTVTPFHFDKEHNCILQIHGRKRIYVWDHRDTVVASEHSRDLFHLSNERYLLRWREEFRERARVFDLEPG